MTTANVQELVKALVSAVAEAGPERGLQGSRAGLVLRRVDPQFSPRNFGVKSLGEFIATHAPQVIQLRRDPDWVYGLKDWSGSDLGAIDFWRVWVSPSSRAKLLIDESTGSVTAAQNDAQAPAGKLTLTSAGSEVHRRIARTFADSLIDVGDVVREALRKITEQSNPEWWRVWSRELQRISSEVSVRWRRYRGPALATELRAQLEAALPPAAATSAFRAIAGNRRDLALDVTPSLKLTEEKHIAVSRLASAKDKSSLAETVARVVHRMSDEELRQLSLPLGLVLDVLAERG